jgi:hypothetical protein
LDGYYRAERAARSSEGDELLERAQRNWSGSLPPAPSDLLDQTSFALTLDEAAFLSEQIRHWCGDSLLAACLTPAVTRTSAARAPWELSGLNSLHSRLRQDIGDARRYALVMDGAVLLYNFMLAECASERALPQSQDRVDRYDAALGSWAGEILGNREELRAWDRPAFSDRLRLLNPRIPQGVFQFSAAWIELAINAPRSVRENDFARRLIHHRERRLKGRLARFDNPRALERWSGESGVGRLTYRWGNTQRILLDIKRGLRQAAGGS